MENRQPLSWIGREVITPLVDLAYPPSCPACEAPVAAQGGLCAPCWARIVVPGEPACRHCQAPFVAVVPESGICRDCRAERPAHDGIAAATLYNSTSRALVLGLKYGRRLALAPLMARMTAARLGAHGLPAITPEWWIVPVPLHRWRLWGRGFNQSALIAGEIARHGHGRLLVDGLRRIRRTRSLGGLGRESRRAMLAGAIVPNKRHAARLRGADILLVDDVLTSGATSDACIAALRAAGARKVVIACFTRVADDGAGDDAKHNHTHKAPGAETPSALS